MLSTDDTTVPAYKCRVPLATLARPSYTTARLTEAGMSCSEAATKGKLFARAACRLLEAGRGNDEAAVACFVPGRIEVLGKHTDYCGGRSLLCTVEKGMCFVAVPNVRPTVVFHALNRNESVDMAVSLDLEPIAGLWSNYPMTVCRRIARNFGGASGAEIAMSSDLPPAAGLSSSSALVTGTFMVLSALNGLSERSEYRQNITRIEDLAAYLGCCENGQDFRGLPGDRGVGTFGGSQDHTAMLCCKPRQLSVFSFCPVAHQTDIDLPADVCFLVASSGVSAEKTGYAMTRYNLVAERAQWLVKLWNGDASEPVSCLREVAQAGPAALVKMGRILERYAAVEREMRLAVRLEQFLVESTGLIPEAINALRRHDWEALGRIVDHSQHFAETGLENQVPATIALQRRLRSAGAIAASSFGAGFGGSVWALVPHDLKVPMELKAFKSSPSCSVVMM